METFQAYGFPHEIYYFSNRNKPILDCYSEFNTVLSGMFNKTYSFNDFQIVLYVLCERCITDFHQIMLLSSNSFGFAAMRTLRSMFEKIVDVLYLYANQTSIEDFINFCPEPIKRLSDVSNILNLIKNNRISRINFTQLRWNDISMKEQTKQVGLENFFLSAYKIPNQFIHTSALELAITLKELEDRFEIQIYSTKSEKTFADLAFIRAWELLLIVMKLHITMFNLSDMTDLLRKCREDFKSALFECYEAKLLLSDKEFWNLPLTH